MTNTNETTYYANSERVRRPIRALKWMGAMTMIIITLSSPLFVLSSMKLDQDKPPMDYPVRVETNQTACSYLKQFSLSGNIIISVCNRGGDIVLDIRLFLNQTATIRGIPLNLKQWRKLESILPSLDRAIEKATDTGPAI